MIVLTFYIEITEAMRSMINATTSGTLMNKTEDKAYNLIKVMMSITINGPISEGNPNGLEVNLMLMS